MARISKLQQAFLEFCQKYNLNVESVKSTIYAYIPEHYFNYQFQDIDSFVEYNKNINEIVFYTKIICAYNAETKDVNIYYSDDEIDRIYSIKKFYKLEETYKNMMEKLEYFNVLIKEMKINERKKSLEQDFQKETKKS